MKCMAVDNDELLELEFVVGGEASMFMCHLQSFYTDKS